MPNNWKPKQNQNCSPWPWPRLDRALPTTNGRLPRDLPEDVQLDMLYAGEGTFWTDLKGFTEVMVGRQAMEQQKMMKEK